MCDCLSPRVLPRRGCSWEPGPKREECSPPPKAPSRVSATPAPSSCREVSQSEKRLFVHVIDHFTLSQENDCNLSILAALEPPLTWLEAAWRFRMPARAGEMFAHGGPGCPLLFLLSISIRKGKAL